MTVQCRRCGRPLTREPYVTMGIGEVCAEKEQIEQGNQIQIQLMDKNKKPENPPAFPHIEGEQGYGNSFRIGPDRWVNTRSGMTLRDYFAASALQGICTNKFLQEKEAGIVERAYRIADAMLAERSKE